MLRHPSRHQSAHADGLGARMQCMQSFVGCCLASHRQLLDSLPSLRSANSALAKAPSVKCCAGISAKSQYVLSNALMYVRLPDGHILSLSPSRGHCG